MSMDASELLNEALELPAEARAALAAKLIESLDETVDPDAESLWAEEITRRLKEFDEGRAQTIPWSDVRASILKR
jgi:putative addiction module component (TIGR02574 family)